MPFRIPSFYDSVQRKTRTMVVGQDSLEPSVIPIDPDLTNIIKITNTGLYARPKATDLLPPDGSWSGLTQIDNYLRVDIPELISQETGNKLVRSNQDGLLYINIREFLPSDLQGSGLRVDTNGKLEVYPPDFVDPDAENLLKVNASGQLNVYISDVIGNGLVEDTDGKVHVDIQKLLSTDTPNLSTLGSDGGILTKPMISSNDHVLTFETDGLLTHLGVRINQANNNLELFGLNGQLLSTVLLPTGSSIKSVTTQKDPAGQPAGTYLVFVFDTESGDETVYVNITDAMPVYTAGNQGISVTNQQIFANVDSSKGLQIGSAGIGIMAGYNLMTDAEKAKLAGVEAGAQVNTVTSVQGRVGAVVITKGDVGLSNVDNTSDMNKPVSTATQTALNAKQNTITGAASTGVVNNFALNMAMVTDSLGKMSAHGTVSSTELGYLDGATSNIQAQINAILSRLTAVENSLTSINGKLNDPNQIPWAPKAYGVVTAAGSIGAIGASSVTKTGVGLYTVTLDKVDIYIYSITVTLVNGMNGTAIVAHTNNTRTFNVRTFNASNILTDQAFYFLVMGV